MPDIQTALKSALSKTLQEWDDDDDGETFPRSSSAQPVSTSVSAPSQATTMTNTTKQPHRFGIKNNVTRTTFNYIKDNPGSTRKEVIIALEHLGFLEKSTSSIISQLRNNKLIHATNGLYYADVQEYVPIKNYKPVKKAVAPIVEVTKRKYTKKSDAEGGLGALLKAKIDNAPMPSSDALDAAAYAMGGQRRLDKPFLTKLVRPKSPEDIIGNMTVYQARELYLHLKSMFGG